MNKRLVHAIDIDAGPERVWQVLTDLPAYPQWNPFIVRAEGHVDVGSALTLRMQPVGGRVATLRPTVVEATEPWRVRWMGRLGLPRILDANHEFRIEALPDGRSRLTQDEVFTGLLVPIVAKSLDRGTLPAFAAMNAALKERAERPTEHRSDAVGPGHHDGLRPGPP
jgi:hypothetical protein